MAKRKCSLCGDYIEKDDETIELKGKLVHLKCFNLSCKMQAQKKNNYLSEQAAEKKTRKKTELKPKPQVEYKDGLTEQEYKEKKAYYDYIRKLTAEDEMQSKSYALTENYFKKYGYTYKTMMETLVYMYELQGIDLQGDGIGLIPYYYDEASRYYDTLKQIERNNNGVDVSKMYKETVIRINPKKKTVKQLDIESIKED